MATSDPTAEAPTASGCCCPCFFWRSRSVDAGLVEPLAPAPPDPGRDSCDVVPVLQQLDADGLDVPARRKLSKVLEEVLETERTYVTALAALGNLPKLTRLTLNFVGCSQLSGVSALASMKDSYNTIAYICILYT